jgi:ABC-2 type transport system permease protein
MASHRTALPVDMLDAVRRFGESSWIIFKALFRWFNPHAYLVNKLILPLEQLLVFTLLGVYAGGRSSESFYVLGNILALATLGGFGVAATISEERTQVTLLLLLGSPANRLVNFVQRAVIPVVDGMLTVLVALMFGITLFGLDLSHANLPGLGASILTAALSTVGMGCLLGVLALVFLDIYTIWNAVFLLMLVIAGVNIRPGQLPGWLQPLSSIVPLTRSVAAARQAIGGASFATIAPDLVGDLAVGAAYLLLGFVLLRRTEFAARRAGALERT